MSDSGTAGRYAEQMLDAVTMLTWREVPIELWVKFLAAGAAYAEFVGEDA